MSRSIYQSNGKPLSQQALYQQKLKQGVYSAPSLPSVGVNSNASDTAALLAASTDLTVKPSYERTVAQEAQDAALAVKLEKIYQWSQAQPDENGASHSLTSTSSYRSSNTELGLPSSSLKGSSIYSTANKNSTSTMSSRINPEKDSRHGLAVKAAAAGLNIDKISSIANSNSTRTMDSRINPTLNSKRSGLPSSSQRTKTFQASDISGQYLLSAASEKANDRLSSLKAEPKDFKAQAQAYANALTIAQQRSNDRIASNKAGQIDLGGGLTVTQAELDAMASLIVKPVLKDINTKAKAQRETDKANKAKKELAIREHDKAKRDAYAAKQKEKADLEAAKQERVQKNNEEKEGKEKEYVEYQGGENAKVEEKLAELKEQEEKLAGEKEALLLQKQENQDQIDSEEQELIDSRKKELEEMQKERDEEIAPVLEELKVETSKLNDLTDAKNELDSEVEQLTSLNEQYEAKLKELEEQLAQAETDIETHTKDLEESEAHLTSTSKEVEDLTKATDEDLAKFQDEHAKLDEEIDNLTKTKEQHLSDKAAQKESIKAQLAERVKEEHAINRELPEHLRKDIDEKKLTDTSSLFSDEPKVTEPEPEPKAEAKTQAKPSPTKLAVETVKKPSRLKRLSKLFKTSTKPAVSAPTPTAKKVETKAAAPKKVENDAVSSTKKESDSKSHNSYEGFEDEISVNNNKGGLFKEEI